MREIVLGTAGHVDHGKTSLVKALTGIDTDRLKEEKKRGITIELGFAFLDLPCGHRLGIVDVPGHEKFVKNMVAGAGGIDLVAFVIAADEGVMPQTREHFEICSLLGVRKGLIVVTKVDMVEEDWLEMVVEDIRDFFTGTFLDGAPLVTASATTGEGIDTVRDTIDSLVRSMDFPDVGGPFRLPVDRIFSVKGFGAVVTGTSISGRTRVGDEISLYPKGLTGKIRGIQVHGREVEEVEAGRRTAINIQGIDGAIARGDLLATAGSQLPTYMLDCSFTYLSGNEKPLKNRARVRVHLGTAEIMGRIVLLEVEEGRPGDTMDVQILLEEPVCAWPGDRYVVRSYSPVMTIGGGVIHNACPGRKRRRFKAVNSGIFSLYREGSPEDLCVFHVEEGGFAGVTFAELEVRMGIFGKRLKKILNQPISARRIIVVDSERQRMIAATVEDRIRAAATSILEAFHRDNPMLEGMAREELRSRLFGGLDVKLFTQVLGTMGRRGEIEADKALVRLAGHEVSLQADEKELRAALAATFAEAGLAPPTRKDVHASFPEVPGRTIDEVLALMARDGELCKVSEDLFFHRRAIDELTGRVVAHIKDHGGIDAQAFKAMTGLSRKFTIPLLEYMDKAKVTIRVGDKRVLRG